MAADSLDHKQAEFPALTGTAFNRIFGSDGQNGLVTFAQREQRAWRLYEPAAAGCGRPGLGRSGRSGRRCGNNWDGWGPKGVRRRMRPKRTIPSVWCRRCWRMPCRMRSGWTIRMNGHAPSDAITPFGAGRAECLLVA
jgi:hypothetical protein